MNGLRKISLFVLILFVGLGACKKDEDPDIPTISFVKPSENQYFTVGDTVDVVFDVSSVSKIQSIEINLVDMSLKPVLKMVSYNVLNGKTSGRVNSALIIDDLFLSSGNYKVMAKIVNEKGQKDKYQNVSVSATDRKLLGAVLITKQPNYVKVWNYDLSFNKSLINTMTGDYGGSAYLPFHNRMVLSGKVKGSFTIWDYLSGDTILNIAALPNPPFPYFTGVAVVDNEIALQYYSEKFEFYAYNGKQIYTVQATSGYSPEQIFDIGENYISVEYNKSSTQKRLVTHIKSTGYNYSYYVLQGPLIAAFPFENNDFMMFSNYNGTGQVEKFIWDNNAPTQPVSYSGNEFVDVAQVNSNQYVLLTSNQVLWYRYDNSSITPMINLSVNNPIKIRYEFISKTLWVVDKQGFSIYSFPSGNLLSDHRVNEEVLNLHLIYNR
jgi:hypothetical protein